MSRATYVMRNGRLVRKDRAAPLSGVHVISDDLGQALEHHGYDDGRRTDSKSTFRRWTSEAGLVEKGNDRNFTPRRIGDNHSEVVRDVAQAVNMLKNGYRPQIRQFEE
jgi:hypothetical protein